MTTKSKWILGSVTAVVVVGIGCLVWLAASVPGFYRDLYVQWDTAELIIRYHRQHNRLPNGWDDLGPLYGDGREFRGQRTFKDLSQHTIVDFARLVELERLAQSTSVVESLPEVVRTKSGIQSHWAGAEPNRLIYNYFKQRTPWQ